MGIRSIRIESLHRKTWSGLSNQNSVTWLILQVSECAIPLLTSLKRIVCALSSSGTCVLNRSSKDVQYWKVMSDTSLHDLTWL